MATEAEVGRRLLAYQSVSADVRRRVLAFLASTWGALDAYRGADIDRWVATIVPVLSGGLVQVASLTDAYLAEVIGLQAGSPPTPRGVRPEDVSVEALRGVPAEDVYRRAGEKVWWELSKGVILGVAVAAGLDRAMQMAETDMQLAKTHTSRDVFKGDDRVVGYERVTDANACDLCLDAASHPYRTDELMPLHAGCLCDTAAILGAPSDEPPSDPPESDVVEVQQHGEVGPVLTDKGGAFTTANDLNL